MRVARDTKGQTACPPLVPLALGDALLLKTVRDAQDVELVAAFNAFVHQDSAVAELTRRRLSGRHPTVTLSDFLFVEDTNRGEIVSTLGLVPQTWTYDGIPLQVGQVESVGTHPDYRGRGLICAQMDAIHHMLDTRDCALSCIEGIPYFYRQFGYEYAIPLGSCGSLSLDQVPSLGEGQRESVVIRQINLDHDLGRVMTLYDAHAAELCIVSVRDKALWHYQESAPPGIPEPVKTHVVQDDEGVIGYFRVRKNMWGPLLEFTEATVRPGGQARGSQDTWMAVLRFAKALATQRNFQKLCFALPKTHPLVTVARHLAAELERQYAWQIRIADRAEFIRFIAPALERRLAHSLLAGFSGNVDINAMTRLIRLQFKQGRLASVTDEGDQQRQGAARMPPLVLTQLLLGYQSSHQIMQCHPDASVQPAAQQLVDILFPKTESFIYAAI